ncbi:hypothetical protein ACIQ1H_04945 [Lysinibacillus sp. NPDC097279]|uniref:hypothetical protein n=1 Tax=Lysinibacillus sp. NPDC097279 TaxID=3364143 RepID=UPI0038054036
MKLINFFKKYPLAIIVVILLIPLSISAFMYVPWFSKSKGNVDGWLGFWGSYLGGTIGTLGVIATTYFIIEANKVATKNAAELNDLIERNRIHTTFLLKKNEVIVNIIMELFELNSTRFNLLRKYVAYSKNMKTLKDNNKFLERKKLIDNTDVSEKIDKMSNSYQQYSTNRNIALDEETKIRGQIITLSAQLKTESMYFPNLELDIDAFRKEITKSLDTLFKAIEETTDNLIELDRINNLIEQDSEHGKNSSNILIRKCRSNIDTLFNEFLLRK